MEGTPPSAQLSVEGHNDTGARFLTRYGPEVTRAAAALLLTLPGIPCIYTGQEIGAAYEPYRRTEPLDWAHDPEGLEPYYRSLIERRLANPVLANGSLTLAEASPADDVLAYVAASPTSSFLTAVNFSSKTLNALIEPGGGKQTTIQLPALSALTVPIE